MKIEYLPAIDKQGMWYWSDETRPLATVDTVVLHTMHDPTKQGDARFSAEGCRDLLIATHPGLSTHFIIDRQVPEAVVYQCVDITRKAWQAGVPSQMPAPDGRTGVNAFSVGVELLATKTSGITPEQYIAAAQLTRHVMAECPIVNVVGHRDIAGPTVRAVEPKDDPWNFNMELFKEELRAAGVNIKGLVFGT